MHNQIRTKIVSSSVGPLPYYFILMRYNESSYQQHLEVHLAEKVKENLFQATYLGSGTFIITKPKRSKRKLRQLRLKSPNTGMRK